jgi:hypothetical protein
VDGRGRRFLHVNNEGVLVIEATVQADLADVLPDARASVDELYPTPPEVSKNMMSSICELSGASLNVCDGDRRTLARRCCR